VPASSTAERAPGARDSTTVRATSERQAGGIKSAGATGRSRLEEGGFGDKRGQVGLAQQVAEDRGQRLLDVVGVTARSVGGIDVMLHSKRIDREDAHCTGTRREGQ
jgi:hypothetical protein